MPVSLVTVVQVMLESFVQGACLAFMRDLPFVIPLSISELLIREAAALPCLVDGTGTKHVDFPALK